MKKETISIKIADGSFYPVLESDYKGRMRLVLTTVKENQNTVQIDLYQSSQEEGKENEYVGSLVIENIKPAKKGEPEIELILGIDKNGNLNAIASDLISGNRQRLTTSLESFEKDKMYDIPDFELEEEITPKTEYDEDLTGSTYPVEDEDRRKRHVKRKANPLLRLLFIIIGLAVIAGIMFLIFFLLNYFKISLIPFLQQEQETETGVERTVEKPPDKPIDEGDKIEEKKKIPPEDKESESETPIITEPEKTHDEEDVTTTPRPGEEEKIEEKAEEKVEVETVPEGQIEEEPVPDVSDKGFEYLIKKGDTLWAISERFYGDPLLYPEIAKHPKNNIKNPDYILAGFTIFIPEL